jgi:hypothetical protein
VEQVANVAGLHLIRTDLGGFFLSFFLVVVLRQKNIDHVSFIRIRLLDGFIHIGFQVRRVKHQART